MVEVKAIFDNILPFDFDRLSLNVVNTDDLVNVTETIPADLVGLARFKRLDITSYRRLVEVDPDAFRHSSNTLIELYLWDLDMSPPFSFSFIEGFDQLDKLKFQYNINVVRTFTTLPSSLSALNEVTCYYSSGLSKALSHTAHVIGLYIVAPGGLYNMRFAPRPIIEIGIEYIRKPISFFLKKI